MKHLFDAEGRHALQQILSSEPLLAFDFDGTLAPIVPRPDDARVPAPLAQRLAELALLRPVAIVTGRRINDVAPRLGFEPRFVVGNHGAEDPSRDPEPVTLEAMDRLRRWLALHAQVLRNAGVQIEDKGLSVALHYRLAADHDRAIESIDAVLAELDPALHRFGGKCVVNIVPALAPDKGDAIASLLARSGAGSVVFVGDDVTDEAVFRRAEANWLTVRIGRDDPQSQARFFLDSHTEVACLLQTLLDALAAH